MQKPDSKAGRGRDSAGINGIFMHVNLAVCSDSTAVPDRMMRMTTAATTT